MIELALAAQLILGGPNDNCLASDGKGNWVPAPCDGGWYSIANCSSYDAHGTYTYHPCSTIELTKPQHGVTVSFFPEAERGALKPGQCLVIREIIQRPDETVIVVSAKACR